MRSMSTNRFLVICSTLALLVLLNNNAVAEQTESEAGKLKSDLESYFEKEEKGTKAESTKIKSELKDYLNADEKFKAYEPRVEFEKNVNGVNLNVRRDGLRHSTVFKINEHYTLYQTLPNSLSEKEIKSWYDEANQAQIYYRLQNMSVPRDLTEIIAKAKALILRSPQSAQARSPASVNIAPSQALTAEQYRDICTNNTISVSDSFFVRYCK